MGNCSRYDLSIPTRIIFGTEQVKTIHSVIAQDHLTVITTPGSTKRGLTKQIVDSLTGKNVFIIDCIESNPTLDLLETIIKKVSVEKTSAVLAIGGGSAIDSGKVIAKCMTAPDGWSLSAHLQEGIPIHTNPPLPLYVVPTTSGTGAEVTPFATVWDDENGKKCSLASQDMFPTIALVDPLLTLGMPGELTISTGLDAISQALESIWNKSCNPITLSWAISSLQLSLPSLANAVKNPDDILLRCNMSQASLLAGMAISHTRTALAHSMSYPLTLHYGLPHGIACSFMLPALFDFNTKADHSPLKNTAKALDFQNTDQLKESIVELFLEIDLKAHFRKYIDRFDKTKIYMSDMITPNRSGNNVRDASIDDISAILTNTISRYNYL